jgi:hypothetical protein
MSVKIGYWNKVNQHLYRRHSVETDVQLTGFIGWQKFGEVLSAAKNRRNRLLVLSTFKIGGRVNEVLSCKHENFRITKSPEDNREYLLCDMIPLSKRWRALSKEVTDGRAHYKTEKVQAYRTVALPLTDDEEPYSEEFRDFVLQGSGLLFPSPYKNLKGKPITTTRAYQIVRYEIGVPLKLELYNHLLRGWRASQLRHQRHFKAEDLMEFFKWRDYNTALIYAKEGVWGLASKGLSSPKPS